MIALPFAPVGIQVFIWILFIVTAVIVLHRYGACSEQTAKAMHNYGYLGG
jgi:hypothetical protein